MHGETDGSGGRNVSDCSGLGIFPPANYPNGLPLTAFKTFDDLVYRPAISHYGHFVLITSENQRPRF